VIDARAYSDDHVHDILFIRRGDPRPRRGGLGGRAREARRRVVLAAALLVLRAARPRRSERRRVHVHRRGRILVALGESPCPPDADAGEEIERARDPDALPQVRRAAPGLRLWDVLPAVLQAVDVRGSLPTRVLHRGFLRGDARGRGPVDGAPEVGSCRRLPALRPGEEKYAFGVVVDGRQVNVCELAAAPVE